MTEVWLQQLILWLWGPVALALVTGAVLFLTRHDRKYAQK